MKRSFLSRLQRNGVLYSVGALILLLGVPLYLVFILSPQGYNDATAAASSGQFASYIVWVGGHAGLFMGYRLLLIIAFVLLFSLPFTLFRIIVAQEILGREDEEQTGAEDERDEDKDKDEDHAEEAEGARVSAEKAESAGDGMPEFAWRGKGFAVLAAWSGLLGMLIFVLGTLLSTIYVVSVASSFTSRSVLPTSFISFAGTFAIIANTLGGGLLALACLFFGAIIARSGLKLWPGVWLAFGYVALGLAALFSGSAVGVLSAPTAGQAALTTPAILCFAAWTLWFGVMLIRLKPEP